MITDTWWIRIRPFVNGCSGVCAGNEARYHIAVLGCWMAYTGAPSHRLPAVYAGGKGKPVKCVFFEPNQNIQNLCRILNIGQIRRSASQCGR